MPAAWLVGLILALWQAGSLETVVIEPSRAVTGPVVSPGRDAFDARGASLLLLVQYAFNLEINPSYKADQAPIIAPDWFQAAKFDVRAHSALRDVREAVKEALIEKYALVHHWESRPIEVWVMRQALPPPEQGAESARPQSGSSCRASAGLIEGTGCTASILRLILRQTLSPPIIDETSLDDYYRISLKWDPKDTDSLARELREKLGIEMKRETRGIDTLVIDSAMQPAPPREESPRFPCEPEPWLRAALDQSLPMDDLSLPYEERMKVQRALAKDHRNSVFAQMALQDGFRSLPNLSQEWDRAIASYREFKDDFLAPFLEARLIVWNQPGFAKKMIESLLGMEPQFPWAHLTMVEVAEAAPGGNPELAEKHMREFRRLCPQCLAAFPHFGQVRDRAMLRQAADDLARILNTKVGAEVYVCWPYLWELRLRAATGDEVASVRELLRQDLMRVRLLDRTGDTAWIQAVRRGHELLGDSAGAASFETYLRTCRRPASLGWQAALDRWRVASTRAGAPEAELVAAAEGLLTAADLWPDAVPPGVPVPILIAEACAHRAVHLDEARKLVEEGVRQSQAQQKYRLQSELPNVLRAALQAEKETKSRAVAVRERLRALQ
jgi:uncharacterized protein (TIGR03435 family)